MSKELITIQIIKKEICGALLQHVDHVKKTKIQRTGDHPTSQSVQIIHGLSLEMTFSDATFCEKNAPFT